MFNLQIFPDFIYSVNVSESLFTVAFNSVLWIRIRPDPDFLSKSDPDPELTFRIWIRNWIRPFELKICITFVTLYFKVGNFSLIT